MAKPAELEEVVLILVVVRYLIAHVSCAVC